MLGEKAMKCRAFAKALHYKEEEFHRGPTNQILESLIRFSAIFALFSLRQRPRYEPDELLVTSMYMVCSDMDISSH